MSGDIQTQGFIGAAREKGASDETIIRILRARGWSEGKANQELARFYEALIDIPLGIQKDDEASNPLDAFLYLFAAGMLLSWVTPTILLTNGFIDRTLPDKAAANSNNYGDNTVWLVASLVTSAPIFLGLMILLNRRLKSGVTGYGSTVRVWVLTMNMLLGVCTVFGYVIAALADFLGGKLASASLLKYGFAVALLVGLIAYHVVWLRYRGPKREESGAVN